MIRCGLYARVSTSNQAQVKDSSLDTQISMMESQIQYKNMALPDEDWQVTNIYREEGKSGKDTSRPEFQKMLNDIRNGKIDVLVCCKMDRVTRSLLDFYDLLTELEQHDVQFWSLNDNFDTSTPQGRAFIKIILVFAELEREQTATRTKEKMQWRAEQGLSSGGYVLGYDNDSQNKGIRKVNEEEKKLVNLIFNKYIEFQNFREVSRYINEKGYQTKSYTSRRGKKHHGQKFNDTSIRQILQNKYYIGKIVNKNGEYEGRHEPIVFNHVFENAQGVMKSKTIHQSKTRKSQVHNYLLLGLVRCGNCGGYMTTSVGRNHQKKPYPYYRCQKGHHMGDYSCRMKSAPAGALEDLIIQRIMEIKNDSKLTDNLVENTNSKSSNNFNERIETKKKYEDQVNTIKKEIAILISCLKAEGSETKSIVEEVAKLDKKKEAVLKEVEFLENEIAIETKKVAFADNLQETLTTFKDLYEEATDDEKKTLLQMHIDHILWTPEKIQLALYELPDRSIKKNDSEQI